MGQKNSPSDGEEHEITFREFMLQLLQRRNLPGRSATHIAEFGWRNATLQNYNTVIKRWMLFCTQEKKDKFELTLNACLSFLDYLAFDRKLPVKAVMFSGSVFRTCRRMSGSSFSDPELDIINKHVHASFNRTKTSRKPTTRQYSWDVNIVLKFIQSLPPNKELTLQKLAGKLGMLILLSTMCRSQELMMLKLSCMKFTDRSVIFTLPTPTKTYNVNSMSCQDLQKLKIAALPKLKKLCPVTTLQDYLSQTAHLRQGQDALFVLNGDPKYGAAARQTVVRWVKKIMLLAGLKDQQIHTTRSAAATNALLMGLPLDRIVAKGGWRSPSTFINYYMKPLRSTVPFHQETPSLLQPDNNNVIPLTPSQDKPSTGTQNHQTNFKKEFSELWEHDYKLKPKDTFEQASSRFKTSQLALKKKRSGNTRHQKSMRKIRKASQIKKTRLSTVSSPTCTVSSAKDNYDGSLPVMDILTEDNITFPQLTTTIKAELSPRPEQITEDLDPEVIHLADQLMEAIAPEHSTYPDGSPQKTGDTLLTVEFDESSILEASSILENEIDLTILENFDNQLNEMTASNSSASTPTPSEQPPVPRLVIGTQDNVASQGEIPLDREKPPGHNIMITEDRSHNITKSGRQFPPTSWQAQFSSYVNTTVSHPRKKTNSIPSQSTAISDLHTTDNNGEFRKMTMVSGKLLPQKMRLQTKTGFIYLSY